VNRLKNFLLTLASLSAPALALDTVVVFNELHYHPAGENDPSLEFIELYNQNAVNIDLSGWRISGEVDFAFPAGTVLEGGAYLVIASDPTALETASAGSGFLGPFTGTLDNGGATLRIRNNNDRILDEITYDDRSPWPIGADGSGASLSKIDSRKSTAPVAHWNHSLIVGGTPGTENFPTTATPPPSGANVALGKTVINGSSAYNGLPFNQGSFPASNVTDGSSSDVFGLNYWLGSDGDPTQFFILDLGSEYEITGIHLRNTHNTQYNDRGTLNFTVSAANSVNGSNLLVSPQTILSGTLSNVASQDPIEADIFTADNGLTEITARYLLFDSLTAIQNNAGLNEIEVYTSTTPPPPVTIPKSLPLTINEIAGTNDPSFWIELHHAGDSPLDLDGFVLGFEDAGEYQLPPGSIIEANDFLLISADELDLRQTPVDGENLSLYSPEKVALLDAIRIDDLALGRLPDGATEILTISRTFEQSPGARNAISTTDAIVINEIMYHHRPTYSSPGDPPILTLLPAFDWNANWRFNQSGDDLGSNWANSSHPVGGNWESGDGPLGYETSAGIPPEPIVTQLTRPQDNNPRVTTFYFETDFEITAAELAEFTTLRFSHQTDDGAVFHLNGQEIHRFDMPAGAVTSSTLAVNNTAVEADAIHPFSADASLLVAGTNRVSVEVHQSSAGSSDIVMGLKLDFEKSTPGENPPAVYEENDEEWIELYNRSASSVSLDNWELDGAVDFTFPAGTQISAGGYLVIARDLADFTAKFPGVTALGEFSGSLANSGDQLRLLDQWNNPVDQVSYLDGAPWPKASDGGGSSLELRHPELDNSSPSSWEASNNEDESDWKTYTYTLAAHTPTYRPSQNNFHELRLGLLDGGEILIDDFSVIEEPNGAALELIANGSFETTAGWRLLGTHQDSHIVNDAGNNALKVVASSRFNYLNNLIESNLTSGGSLRNITNGTEYQISFRAKWLSGSPQFRFEFYYNKLAQLVILDQPASHGTPGAQNSSYSSTVGPTLTKLLHQPAVPTSSEPITISVQADDPDGLDSLSLKYSVNVGSFQSATMTSTDGLNYTATLPAQSNNAIIQFYVDALDLAGNTTFAPPLGPDSRALIKVTSPNSGGSKQSIRVNMLTAEANAMHVEKDILDNQRRGCTIIIDEEEIAYDSGIRLRGSMWSRRGGNVGFNLKLPADHLYRGVHSSITLRNGLRREITVKHIINAAGGLHDNYNDIVQFNGHLSSYNSRSRLEMTRFGGDYLDGLPGGNGDDGTVFKMEGIRIFQTTQDGSRDTPKLPFPIGWVSSYDLADQGDLKEDYRHSLRINTGLDRDDYTDIIEMAKLFSLSGTALEEAAPEIINVDMWTRQFAMLSLCGVGDTYSQGNPHNFNFYCRPDGIVDPMPWDWDNHYGRSTSASLWGNRNVAKLFARPVFTRIYHGHLHDMVTTTFNSAYLTPWFEHLGSCAGQNYTSSLGYVSQRGNYVLSRLPSEIPFSITSNGGSDFDHDGSTVTLSGEAWINAREIIIDGTSSPLPLTWIDANSWEVQVPLFPGANPITLTALDYQGEPAGTDTITVTNTSTVEPASASSLVISEIHYHPADNELEEFIELQNIHPSATIDLTGVTFTAGIDFEFSGGTLLMPGERILIVLNLAAFQARYGAGLNVAGIFDNLTKLSNGGERIRLETSSGVLIQELTYDDGNTWPSSADGDGPSLVLILPTSNPDHDVATNWRSNTVIGGTPGTTDSVLFSGDPDADLDGDGFTAFAEHAMGTSDTIADDVLDLNTFIINTAGHWEFTFPKALNADDVIAIVEHSTDLTKWDNASLVSDFSGTSLTGSRHFQTYTSSAPATDHRQYVRVRYQSR
jgi:hypothetical protein